MNQTDEAGARAIIELAARVLVMQLGITPQDLSMLAETIGTRLPDREVQARLDELLGELMGAAEKVEDGL